MQLSLNCRVQRSEDPNSISLLAPDLGTLAWVIACLCRRKTTELASLTAKAEQYLNITLQIIEV